MSDSDSFINEVSEEVRKDALYTYAKKYGWIAVLAILGIVGATSWNEYSKAQTRDSARATGDALVAALGNNDPAARATALGEIESEGPAVVVTGLHTAAAQQEAGELEAAAATLNALAVNPDVPALYRDLAAFKAATLNTGDAATRRTTLEALGQPGATFGLLAQEQLALMDIAEGNTDAAIATLNAIAEDANVSRGLLQRTQTLLIALGEDITPASDPEETPSE